MLILSLITGIIYILIASFAIQVFLDFFAISQACRRRRRKFATCNRTLCRPRFAYQNNGHDNVEPFVKSKAPRVPVVVGFLQN